MAERAVGRRSARTVVHEKVVDARHQSTLPGTGGARERARERITPPGDGDGRGAREGAAVARRREERVGVREAEAQVRDPVPRDESQRLGVRPRID